MDFSVGNIVRWYETFSEGIIKDSGLGIVIEQESTNYGNRYKVYRNKNKDLIWFGPEYLKELKNE